MRPEFPHSITPGRESWSISRICAALQIAFVGINSEVSHQLDHAPTYLTCEESTKDNFRIADNSALYLANRILRMV